MKAKLIGEDKIFSGIAIDSRSVCENDLFFSLIGERVDGHDFINDVKAKGAAAVVVSKTVNTDLPTLQVDDTLKALGRLAKEYRKQFNLPMAAVTGSYGKTTVKEMLASILTAEGPTLATKGNLNTEVGLPLTLMRLTPEHRFAAIEMGARKKGDIRYLMEIAAPTVALVTNAGIAHIEVFGSEQDVRDTKGELYAALRAEGIAVMNIKDPHLAYWKSLLRGQKIITFGHDTTADVYLSDLKSSEQGANFNLHYQHKMEQISLQAAGAHNVLNSLAAAAVALAMGVSMQAVKLGLQQFRPVTGRLQFKTGIMNIRIIDDTYNANPVSMKAALGVLAEQPGKKLFVMGDMLELGEQAQVWHNEIGQIAKSLGIDGMFGIGKLTQGAIEAFGDHALHYDSKTALIHDLINEVNKNAQFNVTVLVKGSRGMRMEEVVSALQNSEIMTENRLC